MIHHAPTCGRPFSDEKSGHDGGWLPIAMASQDGRDACLAINPRERVLDVHQNGLDLDHKQHPRPGVPGEEIDAAALAEMVEGELGVD